jgi:hypothetical protein
MAARSSIAFTTFAMAVAMSLPAQAAQGGLTSAQLHELQSLPFAVVPGRIPPGYRVRRVYVDRSSQKYTIEYAGPRGAQIRISGIAAHDKVKEASGPPKKRHGIFQQIGSAINNLAQNTKDINPLKSANAKASENANKDSGTSGEEEEEMTSLSADSDLLGPVFFQNKSDCLNGNPDRSRAQIHTAQFTVTGCKLKVPDPLVQFYRGLERVH